MAVQDAAAEPKADEDKPVCLTDERTLAQLATVCAGGCVVLLADDDARALHLPTVESSGSASTGGCLTAQAPLALACWRTRATITVLVAKAEAEQMAEKIRTAQAEAAARAGAGTGEATVPQVKRQKVVDAQAAE